MDKPTDFNDLMNIEDAATIVEQIAAAQPVADAWAEPLPLPPSVPRPAPFDVTLLPDVLRPFVEDVSARMQSPPDFLAVAMVATIGSVLGRKIAIRPMCHGKWTEIGTLWAAIIGRPGAKKSPTLSAALAPLRRLEAAARLKYEREMDNYTPLAKLHAMKEKLAQKRIEKLLKAREHDAALHEQEQIEKEKPPEPICKRYETNDATTEKVGEMLAKSPNGLLQFRDELSGLLAIFEKRGREGDRQFYLQAWAGIEPYQYDRIGRGSINIPFHTLSILGGIQPDVLRDHFKKTHGSSADDGFLARLQLMVAPEMSPIYETIDRPFDQSAEDAYAGVISHLDGLDPASVGADMTAPIPFLHFAPAAQEQFNLWLETLETRLRRDDLTPAFEAHLAKYRKLVPSLALLFHLCAGAIGAISLEALELAIRWSAYLESHAQFIYSELIGEQSKSTSSLRILNKHLEEGDLEDGFDARAVERKGWSGLDDRTQIEEALNELLELNRIRLAEVTDTSRSGRPPLPKYQINPKVREANPILVNPNAPEDGFVDFVDNLNSGFSLSGDDQPVYV